jgi:hypothetical protein
MTLLTRRRNRLRLWSRLLLVTAVAVVLMPKMTLSEQPQLEALLNAVGLAQTSAG